MECWDSFRCLRLNSIKRVDFIPPRPICIVPPLGSLIRILVTQNVRAFNLPDLFFQSPDKAVPFVTDTVATF